MIKKSLCFLAFAGLLSCEKQENRSESETAEAEYVARENGTEAKALDKEAGWLNPEYLTADFNGDGHSDTAFAVIINNKKGIRIRHGNTNKEFF